MSKGFIVLLIYAIVITAGLVVSIVILAGLFSNNNDLIQRLDEAERNIRNARQAEQRANERVDAIERRNAELEKTGDELASEVRKIITGFQGWENRYRRIKEILDRYRELSKERRGIFERIEKENNISPGGT